MKIKRKIFKTNYKQQKFITIPKDCDLEAGDYVWITKAKNGR